MNSSLDSNDTSPSMPLLYLMMSAYGGCVQIKSIFSSFINDKFAAFPFRVNTLDCVSHLNWRFLSEIDIARGFISTPITFLFNNLASTNVVPLPINWSNTQSPSLE